MTIHFSYFFFHFNKIQRHLYPWAHVILLLWNKNFSVEFKISWKHQSSQRYSIHAIKAIEQGLQCWFLSFPVTQGGWRTLNSLLLLFLPWYYAMGWHERLIWEVHRWEGSGKSLFFCQVSLERVWHCWQCFPCPTVSGVGLFQAPADHLFSPGYQSPASTPGTSC